MFCHIFSVLVFARLLIRETITFFAIRSESQTQAKHCNFYIELCQQKQKVYFQQDIVSNVQSTIYVPGITLTLKLGGMALPKSPHSSADPTYYIPVRWSKRSCYEQESQVLRQYQCRNEKRPYFCQLGGPSSQLSMITIGCILHVQE